MTYNPCLVVCVCIEDDGQCATVSLNEIAAGHVFGPEQPLKLILHGPTREVLQELISCVEESCYPLVREVSTVPCRSKTDETVIDVALLLLSPMQDRVVSLDPNPSPPISFINHSLALLKLKHNFNDNLKILVLGQGSNVVASILSVELGCPGGNQLLAFDPEQKGQKTRRHQYSTADTLCSTVSDWWSGNKQSTSRSLKAGIKFFGKCSISSTQAGGVFLSAPVDIVGVQTFKVNHFFPSNIDESRLKIHDTELGRMDCNSQRNHSTRVPHALL